VLLIESDGAAMEGCGDDDYSVSCAVDRPGGLVARAAPALTNDEVLATLRRRSAEDDHGARRALAGVIDAVAAGS